MRKFLCTATVLTAITLTLPVRATPAVRDAPVPPLEMGTESARQIRAREPRLLARLPPEEPG